MRRSGSRGVGGARRRPPGGWRGGEIGPVRREVTFEPLPLEAPPVPDPAPAEAPPPSEPVPDPA